MNKHDYPDYPDKEYSVDEESRQKMRNRKRKYAWLGFLLVILFFVFLFLAEEKRVFGWLSLATLMLTIPLCMHLILGRYRCSSCHQKMKKTLKNLEFENETVTHIYLICEKCKKYIYDGCKSL